MFAEVVTTNATECKISHGVENFNRDTNMCVELFDKTLQNVDVRHNLL